MRIDSIRVYAEVLEQGLDFKEYILRSGFRGPVTNVYTKKARNEFFDDDSLVDRIRKVKDVDVLITAICGRNEYPLLMVEYSTAVPTDDHKMQRSDVYFWSGLMRSPMMKISPASKGMDQAFGGGSRFTDDFERSIAYKHGAIFYPITWESTDDNFSLPTKEDCLSCIYYSEQVQEIIDSILHVFQFSDSFGSFYENLRADYEHQYRRSLRAYETEELKDIIVNSSRFRWFGEKLCAKINRFGHAMDPDRGVLYFVNMLVGPENTVTEIQVNRQPDFNARGGYKSLFDALGRERALGDYVRDIIYNQDNVFSPEDALYIFTQALSIDDALEFHPMGRNEYFIPDQVLDDFLREHPSMTAKCIFYLSTELRLTDIDRDPIVIVKWNARPGRRYLREVRSHSFEPIPIHPLSIREATEDIITFASVELYRKLRWGLLAVSYPGAQGDRCILTGEGRKVLRTYVDIIAYQEANDGITVFLEECKDDFSKSRADEQKLLFIKEYGSEQYEGLRTLFRKTIARDDFISVYTSLGAKEKLRVPAFDVDYIFMFNLSTTPNKTLIHYSIGVINMDLVPEFRSLAEDGHRLNGTMRLDKIYIIGE